MTEDHQGGRSSANGERVASFERMLQAVSFVNSVRTHPAVSTILTGLILMSAFTGGMIFRIGFGLVPLIDKGTLILHLAVYLSILLVFLNFAGSTLESWIHQDRFVTSLARRAFGTLSRKFPVRRRPGTEHEDVVAAVLQRRQEEASWFFGEIAGRLSTVGVTASLTFGAAGIASLALRWPIAPFLLDYWWLWLLWASLPLLLLGAILPPVSFLPPINGMSFGLARVVLLLATLISGVAWIDFLREVVPPVGIEIAGGAAEAGTLLLPGQDGIIIRFRDSADAEYVPWDRITRITAASRPE